jgi:hypothetical protein
MEQPRLRIRRYAFRAARGLRTGIAPFSPRQTGQELFSPSAEHPQKALVPGRAAAKSKIRTSREIWVLYIGAASHTFPVQAGFWGIFQSNLLNIEKSDWKIYHFECIIKYTLTQSSM